MRTDWKETLIKAYCYVFIFKNYGVGLDKLIDIETFNYQETADQIKCNIYARIQSGAAIKHQDIIITLKEYELENFINSLVNHYVY